MSSGLRRDIERLTRDTDMGIIEALHQAIERRLQVTLRYTSRSSDGLPQTFVCGPIEAGVLVTPQSKERPSAT